MLTICSAAHMPFAYPQPSVAHMPRWRSGFSHCDRVSCVLWLLCSIPFDSASFLSSPRAVAISVLIPHRLRMQLRSTATPIERCSNIRRTCHAHSLAAWTIMRKSAVLSRLPLVALCSLPVGLGGLSHVHILSSVHLSDGDTLDVMNTVACGEHVFCHAVALTCRAEHRLTHCSTEFALQPASRAGVAQRRVSPIVRKLLQNPEM